jgi:hypothetical protein
MSGVLQLLMGDNASGVDPATTAWVNAVVTAGGSVSATQKGYVDTLIKGLKTDSLFSIIDALWLFAGESDHHQSTIDIINLKVATEVASPTLAAGGYTSDGSSSYLSTTINASTAGGNYAQNSAHIAAYFMADPGASGNMVAIGATDLSNIQYCQANGGTMNALINTAAGGAQAAEHGSGFWFATRTSSTVQIIYRGTTAAGMISKNTDSSDTSATLVNVTFYILTAHALTIPNHYTNFQIGSASLGAGMTSTQAGNYWTRINNYMTSWGVNV